jgi:excisionase family DNA binding protein
VKTDVLGKLKKWVQIVEGHNMKEEKRNRGDGRRWSGLMSVEQLGEYLSLSAGYIYSLMSKGEWEIKHKKVGRRKLFSKEAVDQWIRALPDHDLRKQKAGETD